MARLDTQTHTMCTVLDQFRIPSYPEANLNLNGSQLKIGNVDDLEGAKDASDLSPAVGIATVLYYWCPDALAAFMDLDAWFSFTWTLCVQQEELSETNIEIGRVGNQITFGTLGKDGDDWTLMLTYNISLEEPDRGVWVPNPRESMEGDEDLINPSDIDRLAQALVKGWIQKKIWITGRKIRHKFFVEYAPMDVWGDGIPMNPHWLYQSLDLTRCTTCAKTSQNNAQLSLQRCGKCGTATYCSSGCQRKDWAVHKNICSLSLEDRGQMLAITEKGGLIHWDSTRTFAAEGSGEESKNPNFAEPQLKRTKPTSGTIFADARQK